MIMNDICKSLDMRWTNLEINCIIQQNIKCVWINNTESWENTAKIGVMQGCILTSSVSYCEWNKQDEEC